MAMAHSASSGVIFFGKIPSRGDFVKSQGGTQVIGLLDTWVSQGMELLASDPMWKTRYDSASPIDFAFIGTHNRHVLTGHLAASSDLSSRRFPFITTSTVGIDDPLSFLARCPMLLSRHWHRLGILTREAIASERGHDALDAISNTSVDIDISAAAYDSNFRDFLEIQTVFDVEQLLAQAGHPVVMRQSVLALGLLLQPLLANPLASLQKGIALPLPRDPLYAALIASFWLNLAHRFFTAGEFELSIFITRWEAKPWLFLDFNGASGRALQALFDVSVGREHHIDIARAEWVEDYLSSDTGLAKLSSYMEHPQLSLQQITETFVETFS